MQMLSPGYVDSTWRVNKEIMQVFKKDNICLAFLSPFFTLR